MNQTAHTQIIAEYTQLTGAEISGKVSSAMRKLLSLCDHWENTGKQDAAEGRYAPPVPDESATSEAGNEIIELFLQHYTNGFNDSGLHFVGLVSDEQVNKGTPLPLFEPVPPKDRPGINTLEGWNACCEQRNRKAFAHVFGREPKSSAELQEWEKRGFPKEFT